MQRKAFSWTLPPAIEARLGETSYGRQRAIFEDGQLLTVLHAPPDPDSHTRRPEVFLRKADGTWWHNGMAGGDLSLRKLLNAYRHRFQGHEDAYDRAGDAKDLFHLLDDLAPVSRAAANLHAALQAAREAVKSDKLLIAARDEAYEIARGFELLLHDAKLALDYRMARSAEVQMEKAAEFTAAQHKLNVLAAVTLPLMAIATVFGMNLTHGLEGPSRFPFWVVFAAGVVAGSGALWWVEHGSDVWKRVASWFRDWI